MKKLFALTLVIVAGCCLLCVNEFCLADTAGPTAVSSASKAPVGWVDKLVQWIKGGGGEATPSGKGGAGGEKVGEKGVANLGTTELDPCAKAAIVGESYKSSLEVGNVTAAGEKPVDVTVSGLPAGMKYENGAIVGTPSQAGSYPVTVSSKAPDGKVEVNKCLLKTGVKQKLEVVVSQWDGANWVPIRTIESSDVIQEITYDYDKQRVRFEVRGEGNSGLIGSNFQWKMETAVTPKALDVVGIFVPPYDMSMQPDKFGNKAYLMGYVDKGLDSDVGYHWKPSELLKDVRISVWDEFGNWASFEVDEMKTMSEPFGQCPDAQQLTIVAHTTTVGDKEVLEVGSLKKKVPYIFQLEAKGGKESAPTNPQPTYQWDVGLAEPATSMDPPSWTADIDTSECCIISTKNEPCKRIAGATGADDKKDHSDKCTIKIWPTNIPLNPLANPEQKVLFTVKNAQCLSWQEKTLSMVATYPQENLADLMVYMDVSGIGDTHNSDSILGFYYSTAYNSEPYKKTDNDFLPGAIGGHIFHLRTWDNDKQKNGDGLKFIDWPIGYLKQNVPLGDIKDIRALIVDGCWRDHGLFVWSMCTSLDVHVHYVKFHTKYWQYEVGQIGEDGSIGLPDGTGMWCGVRWTPEWTRSAGAVENLPGQFGTLEPGTGTQTQEEPPSMDGGCPPGLTCE